SLLVMALALLTPSLVQAQTDYPKRQVELIVPFPPGGPNDTAARIIKPQMSADLGVPVVIVNKSGGGGALGADYVAKARPDGYTLYFTTNTTLTILVAMQPDVTHRLSDFVTIGSTMADFGSIMTRAANPWKTLEEVVDYAKKNPGKLSYGSAGVGTLSSLSMEIFKMSYGLDITHVPFQGTGPVKNAVLGGHVQLASSSFGSMAPLIKSGDLIALVSTAPKRLAAYPNVPTMAEKGFPEATLNIWVLLAAPAKTPKGIVDRLARAVEKTMRDPAVVAAVEKAGMTVDFHGAEETRKLLESEAEVVKKVVQRMGIGKK
ncbi:MAG: tripartite tricarboxylate transporter substrate binding protein, partial [candidate division NC10 bacterium]